MRGHELRRSQSSGQRHNVGLPASVHAAQANPNRCGRSSRGRSPHHAESVEHWPSDFGIAKRKRLAEFAAKWDGAYPTISQMWRRNWEHLTPFFAYPADIRKVIYTTNAVESLNMSLRKVIKTRGSFPGSGDEVAVPGLGAHCKKVDQARARLESRLAALRHSARRPRSQSGNDVSHFGMKNRKKNILGMGASAPKPPRFIAFAPGFLDREASFARSPGIPAPERRSGCVSAAPYPPLGSAQSTRDALHGLAVYTKHLTRPSIRALGSYFRLGLVNSSFTRMAFSFQSWCPFRFPNLRRVLEH